MDRRTAQSLDRYITGTSGKDQFPDDPPEEIYHGYPDFDEYSEATRGSNPAHKKPEALT